MVKDRERLYLFGLKSIISKVHSIKFMSKQAQTTGPLPSVPLRSHFLYNCLLVTATKEKGLIDWATIEINVSGGNKYPPRIASSSCGNLTIRENIAAERLTRIYALDQDEGTDGEIFYKIVGKFIFEIY